MPRSFKIRAIDAALGSTSEEYHTAIGHREIACVKALPRLPQSPIALFGPGTYQPTREQKLQALECYLQLIRYLLPVDDSIQSSCLWHDDLHVENILVDPEQPTRITGIIDWQSTELAPLFVHARQPYILDHDGPPVVGLERPKLPENLAQLDPQARYHARALFHERSLCAMYNLIVHNVNPVLYNALSFKESQSYELLEIARNLLVDGQAIYLGKIMELEDEWNELPGVQARGNPSFHSSSQRKRKTGL